MLHIFGFLGVPQQVWTVTRRRAARHPTTAGIHGTRSLGVDRAQDGSVTHGEHKSGNYVIRG